VRDIGFHEDFLRSSWPRLKFYKLIVNFPNIKTLTVESITVERVTVESINFSKS
jgi:hypothetical protein